MHAVIARIVQWVGCIVEERGHLTRLKQRVRPQLYIEFWLNARWTGRKPPLGPCIYRSVFTSAFSNEVIFDRNLEFACIAQIESDYHYGLIWDVRGRLSAWSLIRLIKAKVLWANISVSGNRNLVSMSELCFCVCWVKYALVMLRIAFMLLSLSAPCLPRWVEAGITQSTCLRYEYCNVLIQDFLYIYICLYTLTLGASESL